MITYGSPWFFLGCHNAGLVGVTSAFLIHAGCRLVLAQGLGFGAQGFQLLTFAMVVFRAKQTTCNSRFSSLMTLVHPLWGSCSLTA